MVPRLHGPTLANLAYTPKTQTINTALAAAVTVVTVVVPSG